MAATGNSGFMAVARRGSAGSDRSERHLVLPDAKRSAAPFALWHYVKQDGHWCRRGICARSVNPSAYASALIQSDYPGPDGCLELVHCPGVGYCEHYWQLPGQEWRFAERIEADNGLTPVPGVAMIQGRDGQRGNFELFMAAGHGRSGLAWWYRDSHAPWRWHGCFHQGWELGAATQNQLAVVENAVGPQPSLEVFAPDQDDRIRHLSRPAQDNPEHRLLLRPNLPVEEDWIVDGGHETFGRTIAALQLPVEGGSRWLVISGQRMATASGSCRRLVEYEAFVPGGGAPVDGQWQYRVLPVPVLGALGLSGLSLVHDPLADELELAVVTHSECLMAVRGTQERDWRFYSRFRPGAD